MYMASRSAKEAHFWSVYIRITMKCCCGKIERHKRMKTHTLKRQLKSRDATAHKKQSTFKSIFLHIKCDRISNNVLFITTKYKIGRSPLWHMDFRSFGFCWVKTQKLVHTEWPELIYVCIDMQIPPLQCINITRAGSDA